MATPRLIELYEKCLGQTADPAEQQEFAYLLGLPENEPAALRLFASAFEREKPMEHLDDLSAEAIIAAILAGVKYAEATPALDRRATVHRVHFLRRWGWAAAILILLAGGAVYVSTQQHNKKDNLAYKGNQPVKDVLPGGEKAVLTLADGSKIVLDNTANGTLAQQGNMKIIKLDAGQLAYNLDKNAPRRVPTEAGDDQYQENPDARRNAPWRVQYNTLTTPRGGQYQVVLPDGTKVWLNAASSIRFPTAFTGAKRTVEVTGEIYFEVKVNKTHPFFVIAKGMEVQVLGTSFNVNAYEEESSFKTSLVEGSVKVNNHILKPGQAYANGKVVKTDLAQDIAWKNGLFNFNGLPLKEAMNQLARWYDLQIEYEGKLPAFDFYGDMDRNLSLNQVLNVLSGMGVNFRMEGRKLIVSN